MYGLVSITAEQLLIIVGHRLADRFFTLENIPIQFHHISHRGFHTGENSNSFPTEVLLLATFYPLLSWLLSPTSLSGSATRLPSQRKGENLTVRYFELEFKSLIFQPARSCPHGGEVKQGAYLSSLLQSLLRCSLASCAFFHAHSWILLPPRVKNWKVKVAAETSTSLFLDQTSFQKPFTVALLHSPQPSLQHSKAHS